VPRTYIVRKVEEESDRAKWEGWAQAEEGRRGSWSLPAGSSLDAEVRRSATPAV
jgi:hypothetical protein